MDDMQQEFFSVIEKEVKNNHLTHAYLIETNNFKDIDNFIKKFVKLILCPNKKLEKNCNFCKICNLIDNNSFPDLKIIDTEGSVIKKEELINLKRDFSNSSIYGDKEIYVIKDASKLNTSSGNTMLKFLEEPSSSVVAILLAKNRYSVLDTIVSRCQIFSLKDEDTLELDEDTSNLIKLIFVKNNILSIDSILEIVPKRENLLEKLELIQSYLFSITHKDKSLFSELSKLDVKDIYKLILITQKYISRMKYNINYKLCLDNLLLDVSEVI